MRKTAMQLLIEDVKRMEQGLDVEELSAYVYKKATELLETEREQIEAAFIDGCKVGVDFEKSQVQVILCEWPNSEQYYKDTYE